MKKLVDWDKKEVIDIISNPNYSLKQVASILGLCENSSSFGCISRQRKKLGLCIKTNYSYHQDKAATNKERKQRYNEKHRKTPYKGKIIQCDKNGTFIRTWNRIVDIERALGISCGALGSCLNNRTKTSGGFKWHYEKVNN